MDLKKKIRELTLEQWLKLGGAVCSLIGLGGLWWFWELVKMPVPTPLGVLASLSVLAVGLIGWRLYDWCKSRAMPHKGYVTDVILQMRWRWEWENKDEVKNLKSFCAKSSCGRELVTKECYSDQRNYSASWHSFDCPHCGEQFARLNSFKSEIENEALIEIKRKAANGEWKTVVAGYPTSDPFYGK